MDLPQELDNYIRESIEQSLSLPVSPKTLELKLQASQEALKRLQDQCFFLNGQLKEKDESITKARAEASASAQSLRKFIGENQKLAMECANLLSQCSRWEKECSLYDRDREALMEFGNEADERAKEAEIRVVELEDKLRKLTKEVQFYKHECEMHMANEKRANEELCLLKEKMNELECGRSEGCSTSHFFRNQCSLLKTENPKEHANELAPNPVVSLMVDVNMEGQLLDKVVTSLINKDDGIANVRAFLQVDSGVEVCNGLLQMWEQLRPSTRNIFSLIVELKKLQKDKENLRINLHNAEEEVKVLFEENIVLDEANKKLVRQCTRERNHQGSSGKKSCSASAKGNKRKSMIEKISDLNGSDSPRQPLSPLHFNSPESKVHKK